MLRQRSDSAIKKDIEKMRTTINKCRRWAGLISCIISSLLLSDDFGASATIDVKSMTNHADDEDQSTSSIAQDNRERILASYHNFCGVGFQDASTSCKHPCPSGSINECPPGMLCYFNTECSIKDHLGPRPTSEPTALPKLSPAVSPLSSDDPKLSLFCGKDWSDASNTCAVWCPDGDDGVCPLGQSCFGDTTCKKTFEPTNRPTNPQPTIGPSFKPTDPTAAPSIGMMVDQPSNHQFCGYEYIQAINLCSLETHCPNGAGDCQFPQSCWHGLTDCDVRDFTPFELGGFLNKPTQQELAEGMGLTYPSDDPTDHFFCGLQMDDINKKCNTQPCADGTTTNCDYGQTCYKNTVCDARIRPGYGVTQPPTIKPTPSPLASDAREYFSFCGVDWAQANSCKMQWCGNGSECPIGQSCFADTECNMKDKLDGPPTMKPSEAPVMYDDPKNTSFCGFSFGNARSYCSVESHCPSGLHQECPTGEYCWVGACNILEFTPPSPLPTQHPSRIQSDSPSTFSSSSPVKAIMPQVTVAPTSSPTNRSISRSPTLQPVSESSNSGNTQTIWINRWCGLTRFDATRNCGRPLYECPDGSCFQGLQCFVTSRYCENESAITDSESASPSPTNPIEQTRSPSLHPTQSSKSVFFPPISKDPTPKSPTENIVRVEHIIESVQSALQSDIFVFVTRGEELVKSSLYTYEGFLSALLFYSNTGVNDNYLYLGAKQSATEQMNLEVEFGIANVALFLAKMMTDTIAYERCTPDLLACGLAALDTTFETQQLRFMCPPSSDMDGMECEEGGVGCACILGFLNQHIGTEGLVAGKYSGLNFCSSDHQSICSQSINEGSELRWITAMTHWVSLVQRHEESGLTFIDKLHNFVNGGMVDMAFLHAVADMYVLNTNPVSRESVPTKEQFVGNFFKVMTKLSEGHSQSHSAAPTPVMQQTAPPSTMLPSAAVPNTATVKPTTSAALPTPPPAKLQSMAPSSSPSLNAQPIDSSSTSVPVVDPAKLTTENASEAKPLCPTFCNEVISIESCPSRDITVPFTVSYCSPDISINELCRGNGFCGTSQSLHNCGKGRSIYRRIDCSQQEETTEGSVVDAGASNSPTASDTPCSLCRHDGIVVNTGIILFNGKQSSCVVIQSFLQQSVFASDAICVSAQNELSAACCEAKTMEVPNNGEEADDASKEPSSAPVETIEPTQRGADLPWYVKYSESQSRSSGGGGRQSYFPAGILICLLSLLYIFEPA